MTPSTRTRAFSIGVLFMTMGVLPTRLCVSGAGAAPINDGGGYDYYSGPSDQIDRSILATVGAGLGPTGSVSLTGLRYDDNRIGRGNGAILGLGLPLIPTLSLRGWGSRFIGDESFRAWRVKAGPELGLPAGLKVGGYYSHYEDNLGDRSDGGIAEVGVPLISGLTARATAAFANVPNDLESVDGMAGLSWSPIHNLEFSGDVGVARNGAIGTAPPAALPLGLPLLTGTSGGGSTTTENHTDTTFLLGVRLTLP